MAFDPTPHLPQEIQDAAQNGTLVVFVGAGISRLVGCPSWDGFAGKVLDQLLPLDVIDYHEKALIDSIPDPRKRLSIAQILDSENGNRIDYKGIFDVKLEGESVYSYLNEFSCSFVTTNYDKLLEPECQKGKTEDRWRYYQFDDIVPANLDDQGSVVHLHGCVDNSKSMIVTTKDYLGHYSNNKVKYFLEQLFAKKTVLFLGYGLEEVEILEYIFKFNEGNKKDENRLFLLQGFFNAEEKLADVLKKYYFESFGVTQISFPRDHKDYKQQTEILRLWCEKLTFKEPALIDEVDSLLGEING